MARAGRRWCKRKMEAVQLLFGYTHRSWVLVLHFRASMLFEYGLGCFSTSVSSRTAFEEYNAYQLTKIPDIALTQLKSAGKLHKIST